ncbi:E3 ubiquitin-protein ligase Iruka isoform X1 [Diabrotica undecimpunctata]|uniref:E3 ubiquitin-protein ligase Iruka isoform X1 n=1 Tax=Diabrotica undecimpunctata TaxID=50387 RepID=UPI003B63B348
MAEAAVEDRPPQKFYCHMCNVQFQNASANFTCPHCSDGFIEELQETSEDNEEMIDVEDWVHEDMMDNLMSMPLNVVEERRPRTRSDGAQPWRRYLNRSRTLRPRTLTRIASSNLRQNVSFENILQDFIVNLGVGVNFGTAANMQLFLGNPGDYAWGREGLDAIVTQLLNQMDTTGPPPVSKEIIDALPVVEVTEEQVTAKLQCSVCWEDFQLRENVRQLPCLHIYHEPCIRPWLELHGTCPICRQNLGSDEQTNSDNNQDSGGTSSNGANTPYNVLRSLFNSQSSNSSSNSSNSSSSSFESSGARTRSRSHSDSTM